MLTYTTLQARPREFLAATGLTHEEFVRLLPAFLAAYAALYPSDKTVAGKIRQRQVGGGAKGVLSQMEDKLLFILVYQKTNPLQTMHGLHFQLSQPQTNYWIHPPATRLAARLSRSRPGPRTRCEPGRYQPPHPGGRPQYGH